MLNPPIQWDIIIIQFLLPKVSNAEHIHVTFRVDLSKLMNHIKLSRSDNPLRTGKSSRILLKVAPRSNVNRVGIPSDSEPSSSVFGA